MTATDPRPMRLAMVRTFVGAIRASTNGEPVVDSSGFPVPWDDQPASYQQANPGLWWVFDRLHDYLDPAWLIDTRLALRSLAGTT
ncbi:MAG: hypothetical protein ABS81_07390 [Pseudonocardia sp. SCN 72-86]|nr:MAG: hypothetical protein ABS81_07390 [Pseudonocardia sp. SCN 72-86]